MKRTLFIAFILLVSLKSYGQAPFTTLVKEPRFLETKTNLDNKSKFTAITDSIVVRNLVDSPNSLVESSIIKSTKNDIDFFKNNGLTLNLIKEGESRLSGNSQVLHYKLYIANPNEKNKYRMNRYNIPLLVITKLSTSYDSISASSSLDVLDYEAAPITLRIMPSFKKSFLTYNDVFYYGFYADIRALNLHSPQTNNYGMNLIGATGLGLTYQGDGLAGTYNLNGEYAPGKYSISFILQAASGQKEIISSLFKTDKTYVTALQSYFIFKVSETSNLNLKIGYQIFFQETIAGTKSNFSVTLGI